MRSVAAPQSAPLSVRERILSSFHCTPSTSGRSCCPAHGCPAARRQSTTCGASKSAKSGKSGGGQGFKGFGEAPKPAPPQQKRDLSFERDSDEELVGPAAAAAQQLGEDDYNEIRLKPAYQMYVDAGFKAQRYIAPSLALTRPEGEPLAQLAAGGATLPGDLLLVAPAVAFVEGGFNEVPELEDLHAAMMEDGPSPAQRRVMDVLEGLRPDPAAAAAAAAVVAAGAATAVAAAAPLPSLSTLDTKFWSGRGKDASAPAFSSRRLMALLGRTAASFDSQDPASMQARHQKPVGFVSLWPEYALLGHSCVPNTSALVVGDRLFMHATDELPKGSPLTRNMIGTAITSPLSVRQAAVADAMSDLLPPSSASASSTPSASSVATGSGEGSSDSAAAGEALLTACRCRRCQLEAGVSESLRDTLESAFAWYEDEATATFSRANEEEDMSLLRGLLAECETIVAEVEEAVQGEPGLDDEQQDWIRASVYDVYDMLVTLDELVNADGADLEYLQTCLQLIRVFAPGSDSHFEVALKHESLRVHRLETFSEMLKREGRGRKKAVSPLDRKKLKALKEGADLAAEFRIESVILRYGYVTEQILQQLTEGLETYMEGLEQMSVMQAQGLTELTREMEVDGVRVQIVDKLEVANGGTGSGSRAGTTEIINHDGMQLSVVDGDDVAEDDDGGELVDVQEAGSGGEDLDLEGLDLDGLDLGVDPEGRAPIDLELDGDVDLEAVINDALAKEIEAIEKEEREKQAGKGAAGAKL
ncbi:hypothetical protein HYH02_003345 [Chlamydomonas schloesseri]|uniref:SET domain-containing protein n=1 Tax=Chlamydomonas schloesseri TaxID=2026947 RepID=A0A835WRK0_9CHLO|nr:hypothetical protein HYH02_003345 [Chlamydomonas schloesseri]|eukprot:KAG2452321.1 hypothetical protein HYH02_003345 [Chlamydomonas schloesseri]